MNFSQNRRNLTKLWAPAPAWKSKLFKETEFLISNQAIQKSRQIFSECVIYWRFWINKKKTGLKENGKGGKTPMYGCNKILLCCMRIYISEFLPPSHLYPRGRKYKVYHIEMDETKWFLGIERSIILLNYGAQWLWEIWTFESQPPVFKKLTLAGLNSL